MLFKGSGGGVGGEEGEEEDEDEEVGSHSKTSTHSSLRWWEKNIFLI